MASTLPIIAFFATAALAAKAMRRAFFARPLSGLLLLSRP